MGVKGGPNPGPRSLQSPDNYGSLTWGSPPVKSEMGGNGGGGGGFWEMCRRRGWDNQITDFVPEEDERGLERG